jgi:bifunctional DNase/RNase
VNVARLAVDRTTNTPVVFLQEAVGQRGVGIWIGGAEAAAIALALQGQQAPRPLTADLLAAALAAAGITLDRVALTGLRHGTYFARLEVTLADGRGVMLDARPSDALAIALRTGAPIVATAAILGDDGAPPPTPPEPLAADELREYLRGLGPEDFGRFLP